MTEKQLQKLLKDFDKHCDRIKQSSEVNIHETPQQKRNRIKELEKHYGKWFEYYFPMYAKSACAPFHIKAANLLIKHPVIYLILEWFRGAAKSVHVCMGIPLYLMIKDELKFMLLIGENETKAKKLLSDVQAQLQYNQRFINDYGNKFNQGTWAEGNFTTSDGINFMALGLGQSPRGVRNGAERPDYIVCDDLDTKERCHNQKRVRQAVEWIMEDLWGCFDAGRERFVLANNRIHPKSILAHLVRQFQRSVKQYKESGDAIEHFHLKVNALDKKGKPTWKAKFTKAYWKKKFKSRTHRAAQREYMNNPIEDGKVWKREWIQYIKLLPLHKYDGLVFYGDLSYKKSGDFKAIKLWGKIGRQYHQIAVFNRQASRPEAAQWLYDTYEDLRLDKYNIQYYIKGLFAMDEFVNDFDLEGDQRGYHIPVVADKRPKGEKFERIESNSANWERRNVFYGEKLKDTTDHDQDLEQMFAFEQGSGAPDDGPDADEGAMSKLNTLEGSNRWSEVRLGQTQKQRHF